MRRAILLLAALTTPVWGWFNGYSYRRVITVNSGQAPSAQSGFPMEFAGTYAYLATTANGGKISHTATVGGVTAPADLIFTSDAAGAAPLNWEVESYDPGTGTIVAWVQWTSLSSGATIYLFYGNPAVTTFQSTSSAAWSSAYSGVFHFSGGATPSMTDSTGTLSATNHGATAATGQIDGGLLVTEGPYVDLGTNAYNLGIRQSATFSGWIRPLDGYDTHTLMGDWSGYVGVTLRIDGGNSSATFYVYPNNYRLSPSYNFQVNTWYYVAGVLNGSTMYLYINGSQVASGALGGAIGSSGADLMVGARGDLDGTQFAYADIDEARISNVARGADWIATEYNNQSAPGNFYSIGAEQISIKEYGFPIIL